jgi:hypothetical protein
MKKTVLLVVIAAFGFHQLQAAEGDTTWVNSHQNTHWDWAGNWYDTTAFPESGIYRRILMHYTLGCPSIGCSEWDYTTKIEVANPLNDSTTQWLELVRIMTPYAGDRNEGWTHEWIIDVTDYASVLTGERIIKANYGGYQDGFTVTIDFEMIEGTPPREVLAIDQIYHGTFKYGFTSDPIESHLVATDVDVHADMKSAKFRYVASGHSFGGNENCAEFCKKYYRLYVDNSQAVERDIWRDDCGANPLRPQTGTWIYERAGWCPGAETRRYDDEIGNRLDAGSTNTLNVDMENYNYTGGAGFDPQWIIESVLFQYGPWKHAIDVSVDDIIRPSMKDQHSLENPICNNPEVVISNQGSEVITKVVLNYWVEGGFEVFEYEWKGVLFPGTFAAVSLPSTDWHLFGGYTSNVFHVEVKTANDEADAGTDNNHMKSRFEEPTVMPSEFIIAFNNNGAAGETSYRIEDSNGDVVFQHGGYAAFEVDQDTVALDSGCYTLILEDTDCDGMSFFANSDGVGRVWIHPNSSTNFFPPIHKFDAEFGCASQLTFTVGYQLGNKEIHQVDQAILRAYPNPSSDQVTLAIEQAFEQGELSIYNQAGQLVRQQVVAGLNAVVIAGLEGGVYTAHYQSKGSSASTRFIVIK